MINRIIILGLLYGTLLLLAFLYREPILEWIKADHNGQLPLMFLLGILFSTIPIVPFTVYAGLMGAKYGIWIGAAINWTGSVGAATIFFLLSRYLFVNQFQQYISKYDKIKKFDQIIGRNAFIAVLFTRMIPIIPTPVINIYSGLSSMKFSHYFAATAIGQIPGMIVYAYLGNQLFVSIRAFLTGILVYICFILLILPIYRLWHKTH